MNERKTELGRRTNKKCRKMAWDGEKLIMFMVVVVVAVAAVVMFCSGVYLRFIHLELLV